MKTIKMPSAQHLYEVSWTVKFYKQIRASSVKEAVELIKDMGELNPMTKSTEMRAKRIK